MRIDVSFKYLKNSDFVNNILEANFKKIERRIKMFRRDAPVHLSVHIEKNPHKEHYYCRSHIYLPSSKVLIAEGKARNSSVAINKAFSGIAKQLNKLKCRLEGHLRKKNRKPVKLNEEQINIIV